MKNTAKAILLRECDCLQAGAVDDARPVLKRVKVLGWESKNRRRYLPESVTASLYEGLVVNLDHPDSPTQSRRVSDRFGRLLNVTLDGEGAWADLHYNPKHPLAEAVKWAAANDPSLYGLSHNAMGTGHTKDGIFVVEKVHNVRSVDLVADPATTKGLHEAMDPEITPGAAGAGTPDEGGSVDDLATHVSNAVQALVKDDSMDLKAKMKKIKAALKLLEEPGSPGGDDEEVEEEDEEEEGKPPKKGDVDESLKLLRKSKDPAVKALVERLDRIETANRLSERQALAARLCEDARLPKVAVTPVFLETLLHAKDEKEMKRLVEDRKQVASIQRPRSTAPSPTPKGKQDLDVKGFARQLREGR